MRKYIVFIIIAFLFPCESLRAQEYKIGPEDILSVTFWQEPGLNNTVRVSQDGTIIMPVIGSITAAGMTPSSLATKIVKRISVFNKKISQASVVVTRYGSKTVYVTGHVMQPGKYAFEKIPNLWKIILEAGGPAETAKLNQVKIVRGSGGNALRVNLAKFQKKGELSKLPKIYPGDTINVPGRAAETTGSDAGTGGGITSAQVDEDVVYIYGQVARPGGYKFSKNLSVLEAIIIAGGPTPDAKLKEVKIIMRNRRYSSVATIDLERYSKKGTPPPFPLQPGDTIFIPRKKASSFWSMFQGGVVSDILRVVVTTATSILLYNWMVQ